MNLPSALTDRPQWCLWKMLDGDRKVPFQADGQPAKSNDPATWTDYPTATRAMNGTHNGQVIGTDVRHRDIHLAHYGAVPRTNTNRVAISRAMDRLAKRGLITLTCARYSHWAGGDLTLAGEDAAKALSVNKAATFPPSYPLDREATT